jgi:uncharacterized repeat protein (TIGR01451 family)
LNKPKNSKKILFTVLVLFGVIAFSSASFAATAEEIAAADEKGLENLTASQNPDGSWGTYETAGTTGLAVLKLETRANELGKSPFDPTYEYSDNVTAGLDYLFSTAHIYTIQPSDWPTTTSNPDSNGNGIGVRFYATADGSHHTNYATGIVLAAIVASEDPNRIVNVPGSPVNGWTYGQVAQEVVDYLAAVQINSGTGRGGWYYEAYDYGVSDNSISGYVTLGLIYATSPAYNFESTIPTFLKPELNIWVDYIQNDVNGDPEDGGSGYSSPDSWVNVLKTGSLLEQMAFLGDTLETQRVKDAIDYIVRHWDDASWDPGWKGGGSWPDNAEYQATFNLMKGLSSFNLETIGTNIDWYDQFTTAIVAQQNADGSWPSVYWASHPLSTTWALLTLEKAAPPAKTADLELTKTVNNTQPLVGNTIQYTLIINNRGPDPANEVTATEKLSANLQFVSAVPSKGTYDPLTGIWNIGTMANGESVNLVINAIVLNPGPIVNEANATALEVDPDLTNNRATLTIQAQVEPPEVEAAGTIGMQKTGIPLALMALAIILVLGGMVIPKRK